jgi:hypothetical protein
VFRYLFLALLDLGFRGGHCERSPFEPTCSNAFLPQLAALANSAA